MVPKILAISLVLFATLAASVLAAVAVQAIKGHFDFQLGHYLGWYVVPWTVDGGAVRGARGIHADAGAAQVHRLDADAAVRGRQHHARPARLRAQPVPVRRHARRRPLGHERAGRLRPLRLVVPRLLAGGGAAAHGAVLRAVAARSGAPLRTRLARLPRRLRGTPGVVAARVGGRRWPCSAAGSTTTPTSSTTYRTTLDREREQADYEKTLLGYESVPQPRITDVTLAVDLYPEEPRAQVRGTYIVSNRSGQPLEHVHVRWQQPFVMTRLEVEGGTLEREHAEARLPHLPLRHADGARRVAADHVRGHACAAGLPQLGQRAPHRRQRHVPRQHRDRADARNESRRPAAGPRQAPQVRPAAGAAAGAARGRHGEAVQRPAPGLGLGDGRHHGVDLGRPGADRAGLQGLRHDRQRQAHDPLPQRRADPELLLGAVGALRGGDGPLAGRRAGRLSRPGARLQRRRA